jgi:hypothetical protein
MKPLLAMAAIVVASVLVVPTVSQAGSFHSARALTNNAPAAPVLSADA